MIRSVAETESTNADMLRAAAEGAQEGEWLRADRQSAGRGRMGRDWQSPPGNLYVSTLVRLHAGDPAPATLALVTGVALHEVASAFAQGMRLTLKWPNDLMWDGAKLGGILLERAGDAVVIGIGVNLAFHPQGLERPVTSLLALGTDVDPAVFCEELAPAFARWLARWRGEGVAPILRAWVERAHPAGTALQTTGANGETLEGLFDGLDPEGALRLRLADGGVRVIHAGDIFMMA